MGVHSVRGTLSPTPFQDKKSTVGCLFVGFNTGMLFLFTVRFYWQAIFVYLADLSIYGHTDPTRKLVCPGPEAPCPTPLVGTMMGSGGIPTPNASFRVTHRYRRVCFHSKRGVYSPKSVRFSETIA